MNATKGRARGFWWVCAVAVWLVGCPQSTTKEKRADAATAEASLEELISTACEYLERCHPGALALYPGGDVEGCVRSLGGCTDDDVDRKVLGSQFSSVAGCVDVLQGEECRIPVGRGTEAVTPFHMVSAQLPLAFSPGSPCLPDDSPTPPPEGEEGKACLRLTAEFSCAQGLTCAPHVPLQTSGARHCGVCEPPREPGQACQTHYVCAEGRCVDGVCVVARAVGEACEADAECASERCTDGQCASSELHMRLRADGAALGEPCDDGIDVACKGDVSLACVDGRCVARPDRGEACNAHGDCRYGQFCNEGVCAEKRCGLCSGGACGPGRYCDRDEGACRSLSERGEPCTPRSGCLQSLYCDSETETCQPRKELGAGCASDRQCAEGYCRRDEPRECEVWRHYISCNASGRGTCTESPGLAACGDE